MAALHPLVLLVQLPIPPVGSQPIRANVPLAAAYLKLFARRRGLEDVYRIEVFPPSLANALGDQALVEEILGWRPWMVGFTCYLWNIERTLWIAHRLKQSEPGLRVLLGGPEITPDNPWVLESAAVDYVAMGEGEQTFADLLAALLQAPIPSQPIAGLATAGGSTPRRRIPMAGLDAIVSPYTEHILDAAEEKLLLLETARGCRYRCKYCYYPKNYDTVCYLSSEQIVASLRHANDCGVSEVFLLDPTLNQRPDVAGFLRLLAQGNPQRRFTYSAELRAEGIDVETACLLREANFKEVEVGLQSVDPRAQRLMGRTVDLAALERGAKAMLAEGIRVRLDLILGLPGDTADSFRRGIEYLARLRPFSEVQVFNLSVLPGTAFREQATELGLEFQQRPPYYVLKTPTLDLEQMFRLMEEAQEAFDIEFDGFPPPQLEVAAPVERRATGGASPLLSRSVVDLDQSRWSEALPPAGQRTQAFTLWLRSADFHARRRDAASLAAKVLADNPHTTLQVVLEPTADLRRVTPETLDILLAECYRTPSYLDWYYSLHPGQLLGAKRLIVLAPFAQRSRAGSSWAEAMGDCARDRLARLRRLTRRRVGTLRVSGDLDKDRSISDFITKIGQLSVPLPVCPLCPAVNKETANEFPRFGERPYNPRAGTHRALVQRA